MRVGRFFPGRSVENPNILSRWQFAPEICAADFGKIAKIHSMPGYCQYGRFSDIIAIWHGMAMAAKGAGFLNDERGKLKSILPPTDDRLFKLLMTSPDLKPGLVDIISGIIRQPVADVEIRNNELPTNDANDKQERLDVNCVTGDGRQINLEMQASRMAEAPGGSHENLKNKSLYYLCDLYSTQSVRGKGYDKLAKTWQVTFCAYTVFPARALFFNEFAMRNEDGERLTDAVTTVFVELTKLGRALRKPVGEMTSLEMWAIFLQYADKPEQREAVERIAKAKGEIRMALDTLIHVSQDERERAIARSRRMWRTDMESNMYTSREAGRVEGHEAGRAEGLAEGRAEGLAEGRTEGLAEGRAEGFAEGCRAIVRRMRAKGLDNESIADFTG
jgi:predicted transposase/invertase (TIGR01784 family)